MPPSREVIDSLKLIAPTSITPRPSPLEYAVGQVGAGAQKVVVMQLATVVGPLFFFLAPEAAKNLAKSLEEAAGSGIVVVPAGTVPEFRKPG